MAQTYAELKQRIEELALMLPIRPNVGDFTRREEDSIRSFVLLAHAEVEFFFEQLSLHIVKESEKRSTPNRCDQVVSRLVLFRTAACNRTFAELDSETIVDACKYYRTLVDNNHGLKRANLLGLFLPLGLSHNDFDETMLATFDSFGSLRGSFAHQSYKVHQPLDAATEKHRVQELMLPQVRRIDQVARSLIRIR